MIDAVIDISHFNGAPDWARVKAAGILGVIHKATQGAKSDCDRLMLGTSTVMPMARHSAR
mgnify:CR=1 FL=1